MYIAGLDIGTTGCKITVFDKNGNLKDKAYAQYPVSRGKTEHEVNASDIRDSVLQVMSEIDPQYRNITGIGITSFGETFVVTDKDGEPLMPSMLYTDPRGSVECRELVTSLGAEKISNITGLKPHEMFSISKVMWIKKHKPDLFGKAKHIFLMEDYIVFLLTGKAQIDYSLASRTMAFDIHKLNWSPEIFQAADVDLSLFSRPVATGTCAGEISPVIAKRTGLPESVRIVSISHDQVAAAVGAGVFESGQAVDGAGTVECITPVFDTIPDADKLFDGNYAIVPYIIPGKYVCYAFSYAGGSLIKWCIEQLAKLEEMDCKIKNISVHELLEHSETEGPTGLLVLPHFAGAATPYMDTESKGAILGLTLSSSIQDIYRACMEGVVYEMMLNMERLDAAGIRPGMLTATGGGARSKVWMQMKADALGIPMSALESEEAGTVGSAMLTGIATGVYADLNEAKQCLVKVCSTYEPDPQRTKEYQDIYRKYRGLYQAVRPFM